MRMKIYQIDSNRDELHLMFRNSNKVDHIDPIHYMKVFDAEADVKDLEDAFSLFNSTCPHPLYFGRSMSVSDVVVTEEGAFFCDSFGWKPIRFDESLVFSNDLIKVLFVQPHKEPYAAEIPDTLQAKQQAVGGYIEFIYNPDDTALVGDDEAKIKGKEGNRYLDGGGIIAGDFLVVGLNGDGCRSLTEEEIEKYSKKYREAPSIPQEDTDADVGFAMYSLSSGNDLHRELDAIDLAVRLNEFGYNHDTYDYLDTVDDPETFIDKLRQDLLTGRSEIIRSIRDYLQGVIEEERYCAKEASKLLSELTNFEKTAKAE